MGLFETSSGMSAIDTFISFFLQVGDCFKWFRELHGMATLTTIGMSDMLHQGSISRNVNQIKKSIDKVDVECLPSFPSSAVSVL